MKKLITSIAVICYLVVTCGFTINFHYCMDRLVSVHFFETKADYCQQCGMKIHQSHGCCRDEVSVVKVAQDQNKVPDMVLTTPDYAPVALVPSAFIAASFYNFSGESAVQHHIPPLLPARDIYLEVNVFRI